MFGNGAAWQWIVGLIAAVLLSLISVIWVDSRSQLMDTRVKLDALTSEWQQTRIAFSQEWGKFSVSIERRLLSHEHQLEDLREQLKALRPQP